MASQSKHSRSLTPVFFLSILALLLLFVPSLVHADLGLFDKDFGGKRVAGKKVSGKRVTGVGIQVPDESNNNGGGSGDESGNGLPCLKHISNSAIETPTCSDNSCEETNSYVNLINHEYQDDIFLVPTVFRGNAAFSKTPCPAGS